MGCFFGGMLARAGAPVMLIGRAQHMDAIRKDGLFLDSMHFQEHIRAETSTEPEAVRGADIVMFCVKTVDTVETSKQIATYLKPGAAVISMQNGVDNVFRMRDAAAIDGVACVVYVGASMSGPGCVKHTGRGDLILGDLLQSGRNIAPIAECFEKAGVPCRIADSIGKDLWAKLILNCAHNAVSALTMARYGRMEAHAEVHQIMRMAAEECVAVAAAEGTTWPDTDMALGVVKFAAAVPQTLSSTAQDIARGNRTEIDSLNGYVVRRGKELGIATPVNQTLHALVKLLEEERRSSS